MDGPQTKAALRDLGRISRYMQRFLPQAKDILIENKEMQANGKLGKGKETREQTEAIEDVWFHLQGMWESWCDGYPDILAVLPDDAVGSLEKYVIGNGALPKVYSLLPAVNSVIEYVYIIIQLIQELRVERLIPPSVLRLKPGPEADTESMIADFGTFLNLVVREKSYAMNGQPIPPEMLMNKDGELVDSNKILSPDRTRGDVSRLRQERVTNAEFKFIQHHAKSIDKIKRMWLDLKEGVQVFVNSKGNQISMALSVPSFVIESAGLQLDRISDNYNDLLQSASPLTRELDGKFMSSDSPKYEGKTFKQARYAILRWYEAVVERVARLYQFLLQYIQNAEAKSIKASISPQQWLRATFLPLRALKPSLLLCIGSMGFSDNSSHYDLADTWIVYARSVLEQTHKDVMANFPEGIVRYTMLVMPTYMDLMDYIDLMHNQIQYMPSIPIDLYQSSLSEKLINHMTAMEIYGEKPNG